MLRCVLILASLSPLMQGSVQPIWQWLWITYIALLALLHTLWHQQKRHNTLPLTSKWFWVAFATIPLLQVLPSQMLQSIGATSQEVPSTQKFLVDLAACFFLFTLVTYEIKNNKDARVVIASINNIISALCAYGLFNYLSGNEYILWIPKEHYLSDLTSVFVNKNNFATYAGIGVLLTMAAILRKIKFAFEFEATLQNRALIMLENNTPFELIKILINFSALILTHSRAGLVATLVALALFIFFSVQYRLINMRKASVIGTFVLVIFMLIIAGSGTVRRFQEHTLIEDGRFKAYPLIVDGILDRPIWGHGAGAFENTFLKYSTEELTVHFDRAHSEYLELLFTMGIPATIFIIGAILSIFVRLFKRIQAPECDLYIVAILCVGIQISMHALVDFPMQIPAIRYTVIILVACALSFGASRKDPNHGSDKLVV